MFHEFNAVLKNIETKSRNIPAYSFTINLVNGAGQETNQLQSEITFASMKGKQGLISLINSITNNTIYSFNGICLRYFFNSLDAKQYTANNYRDVKLSKDWKDVYGVTSEQFDFRVKNGTVAKKLLDCTYCRGTCGVKLPLDNLTIDHQKPQVGGQDAALLKVFRSYGLTLGGPTGVKGTNYANQDTKVGKSGGMLPTGIGKQQQYTTNDAGIMYYSVMRFGGLLDRFKELSMHHYLNLAPVCGRCNSSMSNRF